MSKLKELIDRLCPNGVEYKQIKDISKVLRGKRLTKDKLDNSNPYPVYHGGLEPLGYYGQANRPANMVMVINVGTVPPGNLFHHISFITKYTIPIIALMKAVKNPKNDAILKPIFV